MMSHDIDQGLQFLVRQQEAGFGYNLWVYSTANESRWVARPLMMETVDEGSLVPPCASMERQQAQQLMDSLWDAGIRPTEGTGSAGAMAAQGKHLDDMRTMVFEHLIPHLGMVGKKVE